MMMISMSNLAHVTPLYFLRFGFVYIPHFFVLPFVFSISWLFLCPLLQGCFVVVEFPSVLLCYLETLLPFFFICDLLFFCFRALIIFVYARKWSESVPAPLRLFTSMTFFAYLALTSTWSVWFLVLWSLKTHIFLCVFLCSNIVDIIIRLLVELCVEIKLTEVSEIGHPVYRTVRIISLATLHCVYSIWTKGFSIDGLTYKEVLIDTHPD